MNELKSLFSLGRRVRVRVRVLVELWLEGQAEFGGVGGWAGCANE